MASGSFGVSTSNGYVVGTCYWDSSTNVNNNTSNVHMHLHFSRTNSGYTTYGSGSFWIQADGQRWDNSTSFSITENSETLVVEANFTIGHDSDGSRSINLQAGGSSNVFSVNTGSSDVSLDNIPRASSISSIIGDTFGSPITVNISRASDSFTHDIYYRRPDGNDFLQVSGAGTSGTFTPLIDDSVYLPNSTSGTAWIIVNTICNGSVIGSCISSFAIKVPNNSSTIPYNLVTTLTDPQGYKTIYGSYIKLNSKVRAVSSASGRYGSTITNYTVSIGGVIKNGSDVTSDILTNYGTIKIITTVTDSRGFTSSISQNITVVNYVAPTITKFIASRCLSDGTLDDTGGYAKITMTASIRSLATTQNNSKNFSVYMKSITDESYSSAIFTFTNDYDLLDYVYKVTANTEQSFDLKFVVTDSFHSIEKVIRLSTAYSIMDFMYNGKGIALGKVATQDGFDVALPTEFRSSVSFDVRPKTLQGTIVDTSTLFNLIYPVGSIYMSSSIDVTRQPWYLFGGTWVNMSSGYVYAGEAWAWQGNDITSSTAITEAQMPPHTHDMHGSSSAGYDAFPGSVSHGNGDDTNFYGAIVSTGGGQGHTHVAQPYRLSVFLWVRTA